jgi:hypothetical protein
LARVPGDLIRSLSPARRLAHDPEKRVPIFRKDHAQTKRWSGMTIRRKIIPLERLDKLSVSTTSAFDDSSAILIKKFS